ncbi:E3 ubiquitin-protein ligase listerin-like [Mya arenaria]|uniref:E3 ubiquitin-protein ligase listerin-like n=1 Tax=Mya arenaria TaxID=6604 RepID=UPI0022E98284|nr:E3 ubiquitin-protein ligase listerin-like [Mya arenaria]
MPGSSSKKQSQRTKGNLRPSSSSQAAELLSASGNAPTGFVGFGQAPKYVPVSSSLDDMDSSLDSDFRLVLRKLTKKDTTTKIRALQELSSLCKEKSEENLKAVLPFWPRMFNKMAIDIDHRVREANQLAMSTLAVRVRRNLAPYLRNLMGAWLMSQCDTYPTVSSAAVTSFQDAFPPAKQTEAYVYCKDSVLEYLTENLVIHTPQTLSDQKTTEAEDMENKYNRVLTSSLLAMRKLLTNIPANEIESCKQPMATLLDNGKFWKHGKSKVSSVRGGLYSLLAGLCQVVPELCALYVSKITSLVLHNLDETDPTVYPNLWEAALSLANYVQDCWQHVSVQKAFWPKLRRVLESGCLGNPTVIGPNILPLLSRVPDDLFPDTARFYEDFFTAFRSGLCNTSIQKSHSEFGALVRAYVECAQFVVMKNTEASFAMSVLMDQVLPVVEASLLESDSQLYKTPLYGMVGNLLATAEANSSSSLQQTTQEFWSHLKESVDTKLTSKEESSKGDKFEEKLVHFVKCLYIPQTEIKQKAGRVRFESPGDLSHTQAKSKSDSQSVRQNDLGQNCKNFVNHLTLKSFDLAHKNFSTSHLQMFAQILELDPAEEIVAKVISSCHGHVATETTSHYFVFEICIPWLQKVQQGGGKWEEFSHIVKVVCIFLSVLDEESVPQLLGKLYESCQDTRCQHILLKELFCRAGSVQSVCDWLHSGQFGDRLVEYSKSVCEKPVSESWQNDTGNILGILSLVLATRTKNNDLLVQSVYIERLLSVLEQPIRNLATEVGVANKAELAVSFVAQAATCFFSQYQECLTTSSAADLIVMLFEITLLNQCRLKDSSLQEARESWSVGVRKTVRGTGGLVNDTGVLARLAASVQAHIPSLMSIQGVNTAFQTVSQLLRSVSESLPDTKDNPVYVSYFGDMFVTPDTSVPSAVLEYLMVRGDYLTLSFSEAVGNVAKSLFTSLYNIKMLKEGISSLANENQGEDDGSKCNTEIDWIKERLMILVDCAQVSEITKLYLEQNTVVEGLLGEAAASLSGDVYSLLCGLPARSQTDIWTYAFHRCSEDERYVMCLKPLLSTLSSSQGGQLNLELGPLLDRCESLSPQCIYMLQATLPYLTTSDVITFTEIMVARLISTGTESCLNIDGGTGLVGVLSGLVAMVSQTGDSEATELLKGSLDQLHSWKEENDDMFLYSRSIESDSSARILFNVEVCRLMSQLVRVISPELTDKHWDFVMCSLVSWIQSIEETQVSLVNSPTMQCFTSSVLDLASDVTSCLSEQIGKMPGKFPENLQMEWAEFFSESVFSVLLPTYLKFCKQSKGTSLSGSDKIVLQSACNAAAMSPQKLILEHKLPPLLVAGDLSPLPDTLQTLLNQLSPLIIKKEKCVQLSAFCILDSVVATFPEFDKEDKNKSIDIGATGGEQQEEETNRSPPARLMEKIDESSSTLVALLCDVPIDSCQPIRAQSEEYHYTLAYMLTWKLILKFFKSAPSELRQEYAGYLQERGYVDTLMYSLFRLMPNNPQRMFQLPYSTHVKEPGSCAGVQHLACDVYSQLLTTIPAMARTWWKSQDRKSSAYVDMFTSKHVSPLLCTREISSVQTTDVQLVNMSIKARPTTREVIAVYSFEEVSVDMVISLPQNYPLGNISVTSEKRVGVSGPQWEKWLLQLNIFLQHQNGNIIDGLKLWKNNIDKRFEGVDECMICFYVLHGTNFQLPRITCRTCKKKFHSACLYKWFNTSHNCTCPLCRNVF